MAFPVFADVFDAYTGAHPECVYGEAIWDGNSGIAPYVEQLPDGTIERGWSLVLADDDGGLVWGVSTTEPPPRFRYKLEVGQGLDVATTVLGTAFFGMVEANPLGVPLGLAAKGVGYLYLQNGDVRNCYESYAAWTTLGLGAGVWNIGIIAGAGLASAPLAVAAAVAFAPSEADKFWACAPVEADQL